MMTLLGFQISIRIDSKGDGGELGRVEGETDFMIPVPTQERRDKPWEREKEKYTKLKEI